MDEASSDLLYNLCSAVACFSKYRHLSETLAKMQVATKAFL